MRWSFCALFLLALSGCGCLTSRVDRQISELASLVDRVEIHPALDQAPPAAPEVKTPSQRPESVPPPKEVPGAWVPVDASVQQVAAQQPQKKPPPRFAVPPGIPGADAPPISKFPEDPEQKKLAIQKLYPPLPPAPRMRPTAPSPEGRPMTLADLQRLAAIYSPSIKSAEAAVEAAKGAVKQAGAYPNPTVFFEQDTVGTGPAGYEGFGFNQLVKTANKLKLQQAAAMMDLLNARLALKRSYTDLAYQVRTNYFNVLVALEGVKINEALYVFTNNIYRIQVDLAEGIDTAPYEPLQLRPLALQARFNLIQAQNQYLASWKQLAATLGLRDMPPTELAGRVDMPVPVFEYDQVLNRVLAGHTEVLTAVNSIQKARFNLQFAKVTRIPDVGLNVLVQKDTTAPPNTFVHSLQFSMPVPVWDQNQGNIKQAEGLLSQAMAGPELARNALTNSLADAFNRYVTNRENVDITLQQVRDQVRAYVSLYERRWSLPGQVGFGDQVTAQQTLAGYIAAYVAALGAQWTAVNDVANLLQTDDLFQAGQRQDMAPVPDLRELPGPKQLPKPKDAGKGAGKGEPGARNEAETTLPLVPGSSPVTRRREALP
jgi:cobalt-zinc-cadmium efflux system outer membrane protein